MKHIDAADEQKQERDELRLEDFEDWHTPEVQQLFLELWDETGKSQH